MLFSAVKSLGEIEIQKLDGDIVKYTIKPFDHRIMREVADLEKAKLKSKSKSKDETQAEKDVEEIDRVKELNQTISIFCPEYKSSDLDGIPINSLTEMVEYIIEISQGQKRDKDEKKTPSTKPTKP